MNHSKFKIVKNFPKLSIFLPIYNKQQYIKSCIKSIQCQTLKDIEIIAVNDFSDDKSLDILKELSKKDNRIKIVNNKKNYGLLYSRTIGILNSKGEYLMNLDPDDNLKNSKDLEIIYNKAKQKNVDILSFGALFSKENKKVFKCPYFGKVIIQPELFESTFNSNYFLEDYLIWNKLIKKELFIKVYELFIFKIFKKYWNYHEDNIWSILVNKYANSKLCIRKIIYVYNNNNNNSLMKNRFNKLEIINLLYRHQMYGQIFTKQNENKYLINEIIELISIFGTNKTLLKLIKEKEMRNKFINIFISIREKYQLTKANKNIVYNFFNS